MSHDSVVTAGDVLAAIRQVRQTGLTVGLTDLEHREPELLAHLLEQAASLHRKLDRLAIPPALQRQLTRQVERMGLHLILALEGGHRRLWSDSDGALPPPPDPA